MGLSVEGEVSDVIRMPDLRYPVIMQPEKERVGTALDFPQFQHSSQSQGENSESRLIAVSHDEFLTEKDGGDAIVAKFFRH